MPPRFEMRSALTKSSGKHSRRRLLGILFICFWVEFVEAAQPGTTFTGARLPPVFRAPPSIRIRSIKILFIGKQGPVEFCLAQTRRNVWQTRFGFRIAYC